RNLLFSAPLLFPRCVTIGIPFPTGLRALSLVSVDIPESRSNHAGENTVEWAWAMNAASSVLGSVLAMVIAIQFGLNITLACGAGAYLAALMLTRTLQLQRA